MLQMLQIKCITPAFCYQNDKVINQVLYKLRKKSTYLHKLKKLLLNTAANKTKITFLGIL